MKHTLLLTLFTVLSVCYPNPGRTADFNVKLFGAAGDGQKDDTAAIQAAADAAVKKGKSSLNHRSIYFPPGSYRIKGTIQLKNISLRGEDAVIQQTDPTATSFYYTDFWSVRVTGLTFDGGKGQVSIINNNLDKSLFFVDHCRFFHCSGTALETRHGAQSCLFTVKNCEFIRCIVSIDSDSDWTVIRDTWIMNDEKMMNSAVIVNRHGVMTVDNLLGVPLCNGGNQRWIDNYGSLVATGCRFGAEGGGFTPVYNFRKYGIMPKSSSVIIRDSQISAHTSNLRDCAVYCFEVPNLISLENCRSALTAGILVDSKLDMKNYFLGEKSSFAFREHGNIGFLENILPETLQNPRILPIPQSPDHLNEAAVQRKIKDYRVENIPGTCEVNVLSQPGTELVLEKRMDGSHIHNRDLLAIVRKADPACLMLRRNGDHGDAPFAELKHVKVDLDKTPYLLMDFRSKSPAQFAIKFIDERSGRQLTFRGQQRAIGKSEVNLPQAMPELKGKMTLTFLIYYIGRKYQHGQGRKSHHYVYAEAGSVLEIHELGFNSRPRLPRNAKKK